MKNICNTAHNHLIGTDGGLRHIDSPALAQELEQQGFRQVVNPKRTYYPEYDQTSPYYKDGEKEVETDVLPVEVL